MTVVGVPDPGTTVQGTVLLPDRLPAVGAEDVREDNGNFEVIEPVPGSSWNIWTPAEGAGSSATMVASDSVDGIGSLRLNPKGSARWHFYVVQNNIPMELEKTYTLIVLEAFPCFHPILSFCASFLDQFQSTFPGRYEHIAKIFDRAVFLVFFNV